MSSYQAACRQVETLVAKYKALNGGQRQGYSEAHTRQDFIEPLFQALGWDIHDSRKTSGEVSRGPVDYAFCLQGVPCFFLEAKAIPADLDEARWAVQAVTYAYNKGVPWVVLTDFEELKVFNAEWDVPEVMRCRFLDLTYRDYVEDFDKLWWLSKESFLENRLAKEAAKAATAPKRVPVDERLYSQFREWRELLFKYLVKYNKDRSLRDIDEAIQRILDRLIFVRTCEDRGIEEPVLLPLLRQWKARATGRDLWGELRETFQHFDVIYNSRLFQPHLCDALECEATPFETILQELYSREGEIVRYDFSAIGMDVLGRVYEQYLGHVARVAQVIAKEEAKRRSFMTRLPGPPSRPELLTELAAKKIKRKERGIYYTPQFVVDYIVEHTLGTFKHGKDRAERVRVLDPACGSGSFLTTAYERLMGYFAESQQVAELPQEERLEILTQNIYGVDLDAQAVEIAQLNLLLKALEKPALLPDLSDNIRRGNSLISGDGDELRKYFGDGWEEKRPFNWEREFPEIMAEGGFDVVIGNPPYVSFGLRGAKKAEKGLDRYLRDQYPDSAEYKLSTYAIFINRGLELLKEDGYFGYIVPDSFLLGRYFSKLRRYILDTCAIKEIILFARDFWPSGTVGLPVILVLQKVRDKARREANLITAKLCQSPDEFDKGEFEKVYAYEQSYFEGMAHNRFRLFFEKASKALVEKVENRAVEAREIVSIHTGVRSKIGQKKIVSKRQEGPTWRKGLISGREMNRYFMDHSGHYINIDPQLLWSGGWDREIVEREKLLMRQTGDSLIATFDSDGYYHLNNLHSILLRDDTYDLKYVLAVLNSKLLNHYYHLISLELGRAMAQTDIETIERLPVCRIDFDDPEEKAMHEKMVRLVERMLELNRRKAALRDTPAEELRELEQEIERTDREIDALVYQLYGLTEKEIGAVESRNR